VEPPVLAATVRAVGYADDGREQPNVTLRVEEFISTHMRPLLNYVFFDENAASIPARYKRLSRNDAGSFRVENLHNVETLPTYYQMLNIIGRRMVERPSSKVTLVGCNAGTGVERNNLDLSRNRANAVRDYLRDVWGVAPERLIVKERNLPESPSDTARAETAEENRRVEIISDDPVITSFILTTDTLRTTTPGTIRFYPATRAEAGVSRWTLTAAQGGRMLKKMSGEGPIPPAVDWNVNEDKGMLPRTEEPIDYKLVVDDAAGQQVETPSGKLPVDQVTIRNKREEQVADVRIDRYGLILFDFDKTELTPANRRIIETIKPRIEPTSTVTVRGYTDRVGEPEYNQNLSAARAQNTARALGRGADRASGIGESELLFNNDLPEGRFYCRTVTITVETPVK
jgi:outer membrane protein OmpA-like peptidoglycan-associated protein